MGRPYAPRENLGGNFCGHDPQNPRLTLTKPPKTGKGGIPFVLTRLIVLLKSYYDNPRQIIPSLDLANGSERQQRSERREACLLLLMALLKYTDLASLRVGIPTEDGFLSLTVDYIGKQTGMNLKRVERAMGDLKAAGLVTVAQPRKRLPDGSWKGLAAVKAVSRHLFALFGLGGMLKRERTKASKRLAKKARKQEGAGQARLTLALKALTGKLSSKPNRTPPGDLEYRRRRDVKALELKQTHPHWTKDRLIEEAERMLLTPDPCHG